jgi:hypothetical protein
MAKLDTESATIVGLWAGVGGFALGLAGIGLALYTFFGDKPDVLILTASGWIAALLCAATSCVIGIKLVTLLAQQSREASAMSSKLTEMQLEKHRLITISEFLASKNVRGATPKQTTPKPPHAGGINANHI